MIGGVRGPLGAGLLGLLLGTGCPQDAFVCQNDGDCGGAGGLCETSGYCSFPSADCESGRAYGQLSGQFSGQCVAPMGGTGSTSTTTTGDTDASSTSSTTTSTSTDGVSAGSETTGGASDSASTGRATTGDAPDDTYCDGQIVLEETFDLLPVATDVWETIEDGAVEATIVGGVLNIAVDLPDPDSPGAGWAIRTLDPVTSVGSAGIEVLVAPDPGVLAEVGVAIDDGTSLAFITVHNDGVRAALGDANGYVDLDAIPWDPADARWIRLAWSADTATVQFQTSPDKDAWTTFYTYDADTLDLTNATLWVFGDAWQGPVTASPLVALDNVFVCDEAG